MFGLQLDLGSFVSDEAKCTALQMPYDATWLSLAANAAFMKFRAGNPVFFCIFPQKGFS